MRLDLFLKKTAIIKRRTIAKELVERGLVSINGRIAKPSSEVKNDDILLLNFGNHKTEIKALIELKGNREILNFEIIKDEIINPQ